MNAMQHTASIKQQLETICGKTLSQCTDKELYYGLLTFVKEVQGAKTEPKAVDRKLYYISAEFLVGKLLSCNLLNLDLYDEIRGILEASGKDLTAIEEFEPEPSLGNGGLGRLAACFMDSLASFKLPCAGIGLCYHYGLFRQLFRDHKQVEEPDLWISPKNWMEETGVRYPVAFGSFPLEAVEYTIDIPGYQNGFINKLHLYDVANPADPPDSGIHFDKTNIPGNLTSFLYPDDSDEAGRMLRVYQEYFMVSAAAQRIFHDAEQFGWPLAELSQHVAVQINDTHPSMIIPELIRLLTEKGIGMDQAIEIVTGVCAYTNHTILAEALEKWPVHFIRQVAPGLMPIIDELDQRVREKTQDPAVAIKDQYDQIHMANMDIHYSHSVNGVAALHTKLLKEKELHAFFALYPDKFNNKTNGIIFRRWLQSCNPALSALITAYIGDSWIRRPEDLEKLLMYREDAELRAKLLRVKASAKQRLSAYLASAQQLSIDPGTVFDIQIKRLHEYKRQQMNALYAIWKVQQIKQGNLPPRPLTILFGAKAAPSYTIAKDIIHLILCLQAFILQDREVSSWLRVVMVPNYNVGLAEHLIPAADISEQISLATKEASGTGNMKLMANGAVTLGTLDGANVEIAELVKEDNIYLFGARSKEILTAYEQKSYHPEILGQDPELKPLLDFIISEDLRRIGDEASLRRLHDDISTKDWFMALYDLKEYIRVKEQVLTDFEDRDAWSRKMLINIAKSGYFSSDRTIREYNRDIWHLETY